MSLKEDFCLLKCLESNAALNKFNVECMPNYLQSGHKKIVFSAPEENTSHFFLPHYAVVKEDSSSTKSRDVFYASF